MWTPLRTSLLAGVVAACSGIRPQRDADFLYLMTSTSVLAILIAFLTWLGLRLSGRSLLSSKAAVILVVVLALAEFSSAQPIVTQAVLSSLRATGAKPSDRMLWIYLFGIAIFIAPALIAFAFARIAGVPTNKSLERTREG